MVLVNQMLRAGRLDEFVGSLIRLRNEEQEEQVLWDYWLHRDFERTYSEFLAAVNGNARPEPESPGQEKLTEIVRQSIKIASFAPQEGVFAESG